MKRFFVPLLALAFALTVGCSEAIRHGDLPAETTTSSTTTAAEKQPDDADALLSRTTTTSTSDTTADTTTTTTETTASSALTTDTSSTASSTHPLVSTAQSTSAATTGTTVTTGSSAENPKSGFVGTWSCVSAERDGVPITMSEASEIYGMELSIVITIYENGTFSATASVDPEPVYGTWTENGGSAVLSAQDVDIAGDIKNGQLVLHEDSDILFFEKQ